ncbi:Peptidase family M3 [Musa troglodytarum]|uniref:Peptidase family M3 n=1 Tax=Musa troglodytarum TaxID=320322 RepID=A0A9E7H1R7_9LILI|nr:Peptidase family M3 [Musa troglodytarum]
MARGRRERRILVVTGAAAFVAVGLKLLVSAIKAHKQRRRKKPELEAYQFSSVQSCVFPKMVSTSNDIRKASAEAESRLNLHFLTCRKREDVYRVIKAFADRGEWLGYEAKRYTQCLVKEFERNGVNLTPSKKKELENLGARIEELSLQYAQNLSMDNSFLLLGESELAGMPLQFIKILEKTEDGKLKVFLRSHNVTPILEHCKIRATRKSIAVAFGQRCGKENLDILENLSEGRKGEEERSRWKRMSRGGDDGGGEVAVEKERRRGGDGEGRDNGGYGDDEGRQWIRGYGRGGG